MQAIQGARNRPVQVRGWWQKPRRWKRARGQGPRPWQDECQIVQTPPMQEIAGASWFNGVFFSESLEPVYDLQKLGRARLAGTHKFPRCICIHGSLEIYSTSRKYIGFVYAGLRIFSSHPFQVQGFSKKSIPNNISDKNIAKAKTRLQVVREIRLEHLRHQRDNIQPVNPDKYARTRAEHQTSTLDAVKLQAHQGAKPRIACILLALLFVGAVVGRRVQAAGNHNIIHKTVPQMERRFADIHSLAKSRRWSLRIPTRILVHRERVGK